MARSDDDDAGGATALDAAWARTLETGTDCPLFTDPYAALLVDAAVARGWALPAAAAAARIRSTAHYAAARTKWFDEFFIATGAHGIRQAVNLGCGLDARAWRLPWVEDTVVYEIDRPTVLAFKAETLRAEPPAARWVAVPVDPAGDWPQALRDAGFDPAQPTAWAAEDLDPAPLLGAVTELSAPDSRIGVQASAPDVERWLSGHGWEVSGTAAEELLLRYHRCPEPGAPQSVPPALFVEGRFTG